MSYPLDRRFMAASRISFRAFRYARRILGANAASSTMTRKEITNPVSIRTLRNTAVFSNAHKESPSNATRLSGKVGYQANKGTRAYNASR